VFLPGRGLDLDGEAVGAGGEEKVAATGGLEEPTLPRAEVKRLLQLGCFARPLGTEKRKGRIRGDDRSLVRAEKVAGVLGCEYERAVVLADTPRETDHEPANRRVLEEQSQLVDHEHPAPVLALDARPQRLGEQEVDRCHHLVAELAHAEDDDRGFEVDVRRSAEHLAEAAVDPAVEDDREPRTTRQALGDVAEHGLCDLVVGLARRALDQRTFRFVEAAAAARAQVDRIGGSRPEPGLVGSMVGTEVENVEGVSGAEGQFDVDTAEPAREATVFVLGIDDEDLRPTAKRAHG